MDHSKLETKELIRALRRNARILYEDGVMHTAASLMDEAANRLQSAEDDRILTQLRTQQTVFNGGRA